MLRLVVRRCYFDEFARGEKTIEYRRYGRMFTERTYSPGREFEIGYTYDQRTPLLAARVVRFETKPLRDEPEMEGFYEDMGPDDLVALIHVELLGWKRTPAEAESARRRPPVGYHQPDLLT